MFDAERSGRPHRHIPEDRLKVVAISCQRLEKRILWSIGDLTREVNKAIQKDMSYMTIQRILKQSNIRPHQYEIWCNSQEPEFETKQIDIIGLYLYPPENAVVLSVDEKTSIHALD